MRNPKLASDLASTPATALLPVGATTYGAHRTRFDLRIGYFFAPGGSKAPLLKMSDAFEFASD